MSQARLSSQRGFTLLELMLTTAIIAIVAAMAIPSYRSAIHTARVALVSSDLREIARAIDMYRVYEGGPPLSLAEVNMAGQQDPWGVPYEYLNVKLVLEGVIPGLPRKTIILKPINHYYDLYSKGPDKQSVPNIHEPVSLDDILRANDGDYVGLARKY